MYDHFMSRVLLPPFILLLIIGGFGLFQLNSFLRTQSINELQVAARTTAIRLERELAIRETVLKNTGNEIAETKATYASNLQELEDRRQACRDYYQTEFTFFDSPDDVCAVFASTAFRDSLQRIEDAYVEEAQQLQEQEITSTNSSLASFKQFFPETLAVMVVNEEGSIVSSAVSEANILSVDDFKKYAVDAINEPVLGEVLTIEQFSVAVFALPTEGGSVLAAYDINNPSYIRPSWVNTPIDTTEALSVVSSPGESIVYPGVSSSAEFIAKTRDIESGESALVRLGDVDNIVVSQDVERSKWAIVVASPEAVVFSPVFDSQLSAIFLAGLFVIGFLWVGTFFIKRTTDNLATLVAGAMIYGTGRFDYKLPIDSSDKEFHQLAETMQAMAKRIATSEKEMDERNKEFISIATHELRAPMTSIIGYLSMLKENTEKKMKKEDKMLLDTAYDGTIRLRDLVNDMLDAARLEGGREEFKFQKVSISEQIEACIESMSVVANEGHVKLQYDNKYSDSVIADEAKLRIILNNFVSNAIKYNHKKGHVKLSHKKQDGMLITAIANSGPTIPKDQQDHMFEKFFRVDTPEHRKVKGTGVGMFVTKQYIEAMKGNVWFSSESGEDTVFYFSLPLAEGVDIESQPKTVTPKPTSSKWIMRWRRRLK